MAISKENREFIDSLIDYYKSESQSYRQIAEKYLPEIESVVDTAFGIIVGCVYSGFLQAYQNQQQTPGLDDMKEFNQIILKHASKIKKSLNEPAKLDTEPEINVESKSQSKSD